MAFCDPPYGVNYANSAKDKLRGKNRPILNDNLGEGFGPFLQAASANMLAVTKGAIYICMSSSELDTLQRAFREAGGKWSTFVIWAKNTFTLGRSDYQRQYEPILYGWKEGADHFWCGARDQGDVWFVDKPLKNDLHPTMKPVALVERAIRNSSKSRDIVLDLFGGSGTTMIAAERTGRRARLIELDPRYVDVIVQRWQTITSGVAAMAQTGKPFETAAQSWCRAARTIQRSRWSWGSYSVGLPARLKMAITLSQAMMANPLWTLDLSTAPAQHAFSPGVNDQAQLGGASRNSLLHCVARSGCVAVRGTGRGRAAAGQRRRRGAVAELSALYPQAACMGRRRRIRSLRPRRQRACRRRR